MDLRGKQKRYLRARANHFRPVFSIGKNGLSPIWLEEVGGAIEYRELMKVNVLQNADVAVDDVKNYIENNSDISVVQTIGSVLLLFKPAEKENNQKISKDVFKL